MLKFQLYFILCYFSYFTFSQELYPGDQCYTREGFTGICTEYRRCAAYFGNVRINRNQITTCVIYGTTPIVCCPYQQTATTTTTTTTTTKRPQIITRRTTTTRRPVTQRPTKKPAGVPLSNPSELDLSIRSEQKCAEYSKAVYQLISQPTLTGDSTSVNTSVCAIVEIPLVVGGERVKLNEYPHMALLGYGDQSNPQWACGGSLISEWYILTAAHCLYSREDGTVKWVRLGELAVSDPNDGAEPQTIEVAQVIGHPQYIPPARYNDIALLRLKTPAQFTAGVRPACLHRTKILPITDRDIKFIATGWGRTGYTEDISDYLLKVNLSPISHDICNRTYKVEASTSKLKIGIDDNSMLCAGELEGGKDTCQGDSGGPLQYVRRSPYCMYNVIGVTSFGKFCGYKNSPAVYTRVSAYIDWIEKIVWP